MKNVFKASEVIPGGSGWIVDLSPEGAVNPDFYWRFDTRGQAMDFQKLVQAGVEPRQAEHQIKGER